MAEQLTESTVRHLHYTEKQARTHAITMLERVGIPGAASRIDNYPHQFSGGMRQRVMIAMALSCQPELIIADEPTTALDVTIQAQIMELLRELQQTTGMAMILITHDLGIVAGNCKRVNVMYAGKFVEEAPVDELFAQRGILTPEVCWARCRGSTKAARPSRQSPDSRRIWRICQSVVPLPHGVPTASRIARKHFRQSHNSTITNVSPVFIRSEMDNRLRDVELAGSATYR